MSLSHTDGNSKSRLGSDPREWHDADPAHPCISCGATSGCRSLGSLDNGTIRAACLSGDTDGIGAKVVKNDRTWYEYQFAAVKQLLVCRQAAEIERTLNTLCRTKTVVFEGEAVPAVCEIRILNVKPKGRGKSFNASGVYSDLKKAAMDAALYEWDHEVDGTYITVNVPNPLILARSPNQLTEYLDVTTSDGDIYRRQWLFIDCDPIRPRGVASTDRQLAAAETLRRRVRDLLRVEYGFPDPIEAMSGNGHYLLYAIDLPNDDESKQLIGQCLEALDHLTADAEDKKKRAVKVDGTTFNAARIMRLIGTTNCKGHHLETQPHRRSQLIAVPDAIELVPLKKLQEVAGAGATAQSITNNWTARPSTNGTNGYHASDKLESRLKLQQYLQDKGVSILGVRSNDGWTNYDVVCPFDASHTGTDAAFGQHSGGAVNFKCFHDSCKSRKWADAKKLVGAPDPAKHYDPPLPPRRRKSAKQRKVETASLPPAQEQNGKCDALSAPSLPTIQHNRRQLRDVTTDAHAAILAKNDPPRIFQRALLLTRLRVKPETGAPFLEAMDDAAIRGLLARVGNWIKYVETQQEVRLEDDAPPMEAVKDLASLPEFTGIPILDGIVECPVFSNAGKLVDQQGYHPDARLWYHPADDLTVPPIPDNPTIEQIRLARDLLLVELLGDFPFVDEASRAHALAALLLPFVRPMIDGPTPLHLFDAPVEGTGKTLLASCITIVSTNRDAEAMAETKDSDEWRKRLTAVLSEAPIFILLDNLNTILDSGALASVLTARMWKDRLLGFSKTGTFPNNAVWLASGNNTQLSRELIRRTLWCRIDSKDDAPWERTEFRHPNLIKWTKQNRGALVNAALTLCQAWIAAGKPPGKTMLGMFESWAETIGGILAVAEVSGLLANAKDFRAKRADTESEWRAFCGAWWAQFHNQGVGVAKLFLLAEEQKLLDSVLGDGTERSRRTKLGQAMLRAADRAIGDFHITHVGQDHADCQLYRLDKVKEGGQHAHYTRPEEVPEDQRGDAWEPSSTGPAGR